MVCYYGAAETLRFLLTKERYRDHINDLRKVFDMSTPFTPLMIAARHGCRLVSILLEHSASVHLRTDDDRLVIHVATLQEPEAMYLYKDPGRLPADFPQLLQLLIDAGCQPADNTAIRMLVENITSQIHLTLHGSDIEVQHHRQILLDSLSILMKFWLPTTQKTSPLSSLSRQIYLTLFLAFKDTAGQLNEQEIKAELNALETARAFLQLILSDARSLPISWKPELLLQNCLSFYLSNNFRHNLSENLNDDCWSVTDKLTFVICDIVRICALEVDLNTLLPMSLLSNINTCLGYNFERFVNLYNILTAILSQKLYNSHLPVSYLEKLPPVKGPRTLKRLCRVEILSTLPPLQRSHRIHMLKLPPCLLQYLLLTSEMNI